MSLPDGDEHSYRENGIAASGGLPSVRDGDASLKRIADMLPPEAQAEFYEVIEHSFSHSGWLPTPDFLVRYEAALPGLAERIVRMPEREQEHRHKVVEDTVSREYSMRTRGQYLALAAMFILLVFSGLLLLAGQPEWAAKVAIFTITGVVGIFVTGKISDYAASKNKNESD